MHSLGSIICLVATLTVCLNVAKGDIELKETGWSIGREESDDREFVCPPDEVMIGRQHYGDENDDTSYLCARLELDEQWIGITNDDSWSAPQKESESSYTCENGKVMVGRYHLNDENGDTQYLCGVFQSSIIQLNELDWSEPPQQESRSFFVCGSNQVMIGRSHDGDENGDTKYKCAEVQE